MTETLSIDELTLTVVRSDRRKNVTITVERDGALVVRAPAATSIAELHDAVVRKRLSLYSALAKKNDIAAQHQPKRFVSGEGFFFLGARYRLKLVRNVASEKHVSLRLGMRIECAV